MSQELTNKMYYLRGDISANDWNMMLMRNENNESLRELNALLALNVCTHTFPHKQEKSAIEDNVCAICDKTFGDICDHTKVYANFSFMSNPPITPWICSECGTRGEDKGNHKHDSYDELKEKFKDV